MNAPTANPAAVDKIEVIEGSLRCFTLGLIGVIPVLGIPLAIAALANYFQVKRLVGTHWNPAQTYLTWGLATALSGLFLTIIIAGVVGSIIFLKLT